VIGGVLSLGIIVVFASLPARRSLTKYAHNQSISLCLVICIGNLDAGCRLDTVLIVCIVRPDTIINRYIMRNFSVSHYLPAQASVWIVVGILE
jgi:hypothetical protein